MIVKHSLTDRERKQLDFLLWEVLWKDLGLPTDFRSQVKLNSLEVELAAVIDGRVIGALTVNWLSPQSIELRHIAVHPRYQKQDVGRRLHQALLELLNDHAPLTIETHARNTSADFFASLGYARTGEVLRLPEFDKFGITIHKMEYGFKGLGTKKPGMKKSG